MRDQIEAMKRFGFSLPKGGGEFVSTGSTLLDLSISGGCSAEGGIPTGIFVEVFGPSGSGKTALLAQVAANVQRLGGSVVFFDPEARLNPGFVSTFGVDHSQVDYARPDTVRELFTVIREWIESQDDTRIMGVFADSLAALSTDMEMGSDEGDKMGMRRAKEFSEELRRTARLIASKKVILMASNQVRENVDAGPYGVRYTAPGGKAIEFYASLRLRSSSPDKLKVTRVVGGKELQRTVGVKTTFEVVKSSVWRPFGSADVYLLYDYGIDDIRANLTFLKSVSKGGSYVVGERDLGKIIDQAIRKVEEDGLEVVLRKEVIDTWREVEDQFRVERKPRAK